MNVSKSLHYNPLFQTLKTNFWAWYKNTILFSLQPTPWYNIRNCGYFVTSELAPVAPLCKSYFYPNLSNFPSWFITMRLCHLARIQVSNKQHNSFISNTASNRLSLHVSNWSLWSQNIHIIFYLLSFTTKLQLLVCVCIMYWKHQIFMLLIRCTTWRRQKVLKVTISSAKD